MRTPLCDELGIEFPIFAFTHCRDVVAAVSKAGGFGVLGAVGFTPEQLEVELQWIDEHIGDKPYGVDIVIPGKYEGMDDMDPEHLAEELRKMVPQAHVDFADKILADHGVPELPPEENERMRLLGWTAATAMPQIEVALAHPKVRLIANALGTPPAGRHRPHPRGRPQGGRAVRLAVPGPEAPRRGRRHRHRPGRRGRRPHRRRRLDRAVAAGRQGHRARRRCWRPAASARASRSPPRWRWARRACGPARCGSRSRRPTCRRPRSSSCSTPGRATRCARGRSPASPAACSRATGPRRGTRADTPDPLPMPMQYMVSGNCVARGHRYADKAQAVQFNPVGQVVGQLNSVEKTASVIQRLVEEYLDAVDGLTVLQEA